MFEALYQSSGYTFKDPDLLTLALTHKSASETHNERLEFLGDALLSFVVGNELYRRYPKATEGQLSRIRAHLVNREFLSKLASQISLGQWIQTGPSEQKKPHSDNKLADTFEAFVGALFLDSNIVTCTERLLDWYGSDLSAIRLTEKVGQDSKTALQELCQAKQWPLPSYSLIKKTGPAHACIYHVQCKVDGCATTGSAGSRRAAEQAAALNMRQQLDTNT